MERAISSNERIRRAEEIYAQRQNLRERTKRATVNVSEPRNFKLLKRLALQVIICVLIYFIFYLVDTTNYSFSQSALNKTEELISHDVDFMGIYNNVINVINNYMSSIGIQNVESTEENKLEGQMENETINEEQNLVTEQENIENQNVAAVSAEIEETTVQTEVKNVELSETDRIKQQYSFILPVSGTVSSEFGTREATSSVMSTYHKGIDIAAVTGTSIVAATSGTVTIARHSSSYGNYIMIENGEVKTVYAHCSKLLASVRRYDKPRTRNCTSSVRHGNTTGPHLHFEIRINDVCINPRLILNF